jgi:hydroxymethylpyrimidine pyrophosphatase-like HAD family hydrolase
VATGRALHGAIDILDGHGFSLPQIYKNGVMIWNPANSPATASITCSRLTRSSTWPRACWPQ